MPTLRQRSSSWGAGGRRKRPLSRCVQCSAARAGQGEVVGGGGQRERHCRGASHPLLDPLPQALEIDSSYLKARMCRARAYDKLGNVLSAIIDYQVTGEGGRLACWRLRALACTHTHAVCMVAGS